MHLLPHHPATLLLQKIQLFLPLRIMLILKMMRMMILRATMIRDKLQDSGNKTLGSLLCFHMEEGLLIFGACLVMSGDRGSAGG